MKRKGFLQVSFGWLFGVIAGIFILSLAIYGATKLLRTEQEVQTAETGTELGILLNPLETSFETGKTNSFSLPIETRIFNDCQEDGTFGSQMIKLTQKNFGKWTETDIESGFQNKYIFSERPIEGEKFFIFSKQFTFPFKVADLTFMTSSLQKYCFVNSPENIEEELTDLGQENIEVNNCSEESIRVCFDGENCEISVNYEGGIIKKQTEQIRFGGDSLMYAGIFSDSRIYECQIKRLMKRTGSLALLYKDKAAFISRTGCDSNLNDDLLLLNSMASNLQSSSELQNIAIKSQELNDNNEVASCRLW